ncbi:MAG: hypothetical protein J5793_05255 [Clostridia bacterium]|nr:hypothetical protein [Clostridia bacterium]
MKKFLVLALLIVFLVPLMAACNNGGDTESKAEISDVSQSENSGEIDLNHFEVPQKDMQGREFKILCWDFGYGSNSILGFTGEVLYNEEQPDAVDNAKKRVIDIVEERFNCTISGDLVHDSNNRVSEMVKNMVDSGLVEYDFIFENIFYTTPLVTDNKLEVLNDISTIDLTAPWWDQNSVKDLSIAHRNYFVAGDINTYDNQGTWCVLFNKDLKESLGITEDFYDLARNYKWTMDKFMEICMTPGFTRDFNGDGALDEKDQWAFGTETYNMYVQLIAGGQKIAQKDEDDLPYLTIYNDPEATYTMLQKIVDFYNREDIVMDANTPKYESKGFSNVWEETVWKAFTDGRELFYMCGLINVASFRKMEDEFGILPVPTYYDYQDEYHHTVSMHNSTVLSIPLGVEGLEDVGTIISALSEESRKYVTPAYYDKQLKYRDMRDDESGEMLDMIFASRTFDIGAAFNWNGILWQYMSTDKNVQSRFEAIVTATQNELEKTLEAIDALD